MKRKVLAELINSLVSCTGRPIGENFHGRWQDRREALKISDWIKALETVEDSVKTRRSAISGSRDYLNFVHVLLRKPKERNGSANLRQECATHPGRVHDHSPNVRTRHTVQERNRKG